MFVEKKPKACPTSRAIAVCFCEWDGKLLFLQRAAGCKEPGTWTAPGGKLEQGEAPLQGAIREVQEETGIVLVPGSVESKGTLLGHFSKDPFPVHLFYVKLSCFPLVVLRQAEHQNFRWCSFEELFSLPLITGAKQCLQMAFPKQVQMVNTDTAKGLSN